MYIYLDYVHYLDYVQILAATDKTGNIAVVAMLRAFQLVIWRWARRMEWVGGRPIYSQHAQPPPTRPFHVS